MPLIDDELKQFALNFAIVGVTAACAKTVTAPFERVKLILQNQQSVLHILSGKRQAYKGIIDCFVRFPQEQGYLSFWRGNGVNLIRCFPSQALNFAFYDFYKQRFYKLIGRDSSAKATFVKFVSGGLAGACSTFVVYPLEFCQTRVAVDIGGDTRKSKRTAPAVEREFFGLTDCVSKVRAAEGIRGLYKGLVISITGVSLYRALYFGLFDAVKKLWARQELHSYHDAPKPPFFLGLFFAQIVTCLSGTFSYPLDTVGRRLMMESGRPKELQTFHSTFGAVKAMYKHEGGIKTFYRGAGANCLRGLSGAMVLVFYDEILHYTQWKQWISTGDKS